MNLVEGGIHRVEVAEHVGGEHSIEGLVRQRKGLTHGHQKVRRVVECQHLWRRIKCHHLAVPEYLVGGTGSRTQVEEPATRKAIDRCPPPRLIPPERQDPVQPVVAPAMSAKTSPLDMVGRCARTTGREILSTVGQVVPGPTQ